MAALFLYPFQSDVEERKNSQQLLNLLEERHLYDDIRSSERELFNLIFPMKNYSPQNIVKLREDIIKIGLSPEVIEIPLASICTQSLGLIKSSVISEYIEIFMAAFLLLIQSKNRDQLSWKFWEFSFDGNIGFTLPCLLIYSVISWVIRMPIYIARVKMRENIKLTEKEQKLCETEFRSFLKSEKMISAENIWDKDLDKKLLFENSLSILSKNCVFFENEFGQDVFKYEPHHEN